MNPLQVKSLAFYGGTIAFVVGLFSLVTAYGEANLKAAQSIEGTYLFNLPSTASCQEGGAIILFLQQSGIYVAAGLAHPTLRQNQTALPSLNLSGQWQNHHLHLSGMLPLRALCTAIAKSSIAANPVSVSIEGNITQPATKITGTLSLDRVTIPLVAQRQSTPKVEAP